MSTSTTVIREAPWAAGLRGARANLVPGLALQVFALALVLAYYWHEPTRALLTRLSVWRGEVGVMFAIVSTALVGGLLPFLYLKSNPATRSLYPWAYGWAVTAFWGYKGFEIDLWYRVLAWAVGEGNSAGTVLTKMALDQFVYCPLVAVPLTIAVYDWCEHDFNFSVFFADLRAPRWYMRRVLPLLISNLGVWVPAVCIIYALPTPLQLPLQNVVLCFFTLMVAHIARREKKPAPVINTGRECV